MNLRHYDPQSRRFISPDPVVAGLYDTQAWNRYSYVRNNPLRWIDPTGAYAQSSVPSNLNLHASYSPAPVGVIAVLAAAIASSAAAGAIGGFFKTLGRRLRNRFRKSKGSRSGVPSSATPPASYASAAPTVLDQFEQAARTQGGQLRDAAAAGVSALERAWEDPVGTVRNGVVGHFQSLGNAAIGYGGAAAAHFSGIGSGLWEVGGDLIDDPIGTATQMGRSTVFGVVDNVSGVLEAEATTFEALREFDLSGAAAAQWEAATNSYEAAGTVVPAAKGLKSVAGVARRGAKAASGAAGGGGIVNRGGRFANLDRIKLAGEVGHHTPQNAFNRSIGLSRANGPALGMTTADHALTRSFAGRGRRSMRLDSGASARDRLARDIRDVRRLFSDGKYDRGIREMLDYAKTLPEFQR